MRRLTLVAVVSLVALAGMHQRAPDVTATRLFADHEITKNGCGVQRWSVKTGMDRDAQRVDLNRPYPTTLEDLVQLPKQKKLPGHRRLGPNELRVWSMTAQLDKYRMEPDSDYHLVLSGSHGLVMIAEIPAPRCVGKQSPFRSRIVAARHGFENLYHVTRHWQEIDKPIALTGVGFYDKVHGQDGAAANGFELHPVLSVAAIPSTATPTSTPTNTPTSTPFPTSTPTLTPTPTATVTPTSTPTTTPSPTSTETPTETPTVVPVYRAPSTPTPAPAYVPPTPVPVYNPPPSSGCLTDGDNDDRGLPPGNNDKDLTGCP